MKLNQLKLAKALQKKLANESLSFRMAAKESGISSATLNRLTNCQFLPDVNTYATICKWMDKDMVYFFTKK